MANRALRSARRPLLPLFLFILSLGCVPVAAVSGRPAAVLPKNEWRVCGTVGWTGYEEEVQSGTSTARGPVFYVHGSRGLGRRTDFRLGGMILGGEDVFLGTQIWGDVRTQILGRPYEGYPRAGSGPFPLDLSLEVGCGALSASIGPSDEDIGAFSDWYYGVNVSFPLTNATPYLSYRRHRGKYDYREPGDEGEFHQDSLIAGIEFAGADAVYALEVSYGMPVGRVPEDFDGGWTVWGVSLTWYLSPKAPRRGKAR